MGKDYMKVGKHAIKQFIGDEEINKKFSPEKVNNFVNNTGLKLMNNIDKFGVVLNNTQMRVFEAILKALTNTNYNGDEPKKRGEALNEFKDNYSNPNAGQILITNENAPYKNINTIPVIKVTQTELIELAGYDPRKQSDRQNVTQALNFLAMHQFCFYWERLKREKGIPVKYKDGGYKKEEVMEVGTLLRVKYVRDEKTKILQYYEIHPSACMLDQVNNYFLLIPNDWREEVKRITKKQVSSYTYLFLIWLRMEFEKIRRNNAKKKLNEKKRDYKVVVTYEELAKILKMPESLYKKKRATAQRVFDEAYLIAYLLGYLIEGDEQDGIYTYYLDKDFYPQPGKLV